MSISLDTGFRIVSIFLGFIAAFLGYKIYTHTKGATKGWLYISLFSLCLFLWSLSMIVFKVFDVFWLRISLGTLFFTAMAYLIPLSYSKLAVDFKIKKPAWINVRSSLIATTIFLLIILMININSLNERRMLSISHFLLGICLLYASIPTYYLMKTTKRSPWVIAFLFTLTVGVGMNIGQYYNNCCGAQGALQNTASCAGYDMDYTSVYAASCHSDIVYFGSTYQILLFIGIMFANISFYLTWKRLS